VCFSCVWAVCVCFRRHFWGVDGSLVGEGRGLARSISSSSTLETDNKRPLPYQLDDKIGGKGRS
jgi:hypothetical protein